MWSAWRGGTRVAVGASGQDLLSWELEEGSVERSGVVFAPEQTCGEWESVGLVDVPVLLIMSAVAAVAVMTAVTRFVVLVFVFFCSDEPWFSERMQSNTKQVKPHLPLSQFLPLKPGQQAFFVTILTWGQSWPFSILFFSSLVRSFE